MKNSALVVIDLQNDITKNYKEIIEKSTKQSIGLFKRNYGSFTFSITTCLREQEPSSPARTVQNLSLK